MGIQLLAENYDPAGLERTEIASAISASGTTLTVDNTEGFSADDYIILGTNGTENAEIVKISSVDSDTQLTIGATNFAHSENDPVVLTPFNQIKFYSSSTETGTYSNIATENMEVDNLNKCTAYYHSAGTTSTWYKYTYYNSTTATETDKDDSTAFKGTYDLYCTVRDISDYLGITLDNDSSPSAATILDMIEYTTEEIDTVLNTSFKSNTIGADTNNYTDYEYHDGIGGKMTVEGETFYQDTYFLDHIPIISIDDLDITTNPDTTDADSTTWNDLTENTDYYVDKNTGRIKIVTNSYLPPKGNKRMRVAYTWGRSSVPKDVRKLAILMIIRDLMKTAVGRSLIQGHDEFNTVQYESLDKDIDRLIKKYQNYDILPII